MSVYTYENQWVFIHMKINECLYIWKSMMFIHMIINDFTAMKYNYFIYGHSSFTVASKNCKWLNDTKKQ